MFQNMDRLHPRGAANRGICVDAEGAMLGPDCVLVRRTAYGYRAIERDDAAVLQKGAFTADLDPDWLFRQTRRIADALDNGEVALAQIYGLRIPVGELDDRKLCRLSALAFAKAYNPDEPRIPKGQPHAGEWTSGDASETTDAASELSATDDSGDSGGGEDGTGNGDDGAPPPSDAGASPGAGDSPSGAAATDDGSDAPPPSDDPMRFRWPSPDTSPPSAPPPANDTNAGNSPSTLGSPDIGDGIPGVSSTGDTSPSGEEPAEDAGPDLSAPPPEIPPEEPTTTKQRNAVLRTIATWLGRAMAVLGTAYFFDPRVRMVLAALEATAWLAQYLPKILSYVDDPKSLEDLQNAVGTRLGYETHHIVEAQKKSENPSSNAQRFPDRIDSRENLVRVPYWKHVEISSWYSRRNDQFGDVSPRKFLRGKSWEEQYSVGLKVLRDFGVLR